MRLTLLLTTLLVAGCAESAPVAPPPVPPTVARAAVPAAAAGAEASAASPREDMSRQLGGLRLGMTADEVTAACRGAQGNLVRVSEIDLTCSVAPVPLRSPTAARVDLSGQVAAKLCGDGATVCELVYRFNGDVPHRDEQIAALVEMLEGKYGTPSTASGPAGKDPMARCQKHRALLLERGWTFGEKQTPPHPAGLVRLTFRCDLRVSTESHDLELLYSDERGMRYRANEHASVPNNY